jgi:hypothetical protein
MIVLDKIGPWGVSFLFSAVLLLHLVSLWHAAVHHQWGWALAIILFPMLGVIAYWAFAGARPSTA